MLTSAMRIKSASSPTMTAAAIPQAVVVIRHSATAAASQRGTAIWCFGQHDPTLDMRYQVRQSTRTTGHLPLSSAAAGATVLKQRCVQWWRSRSHDFAGKEQRHVKYFDRHVKYFDRHQQQSLASQTGTTAHTLPAVSTNVDCALTMGVCRVDRMLASGSGQPA